MNNHLDGETSGTVIQVGSIRGNVSVRTAPPAAAVRSLPADTSVFTGREAELVDVTMSLKERMATAGCAGTYSIDGMAGIGKTTFAVHISHSLASMFPDGQLIVRLHGHTPGQQPVDPSDALATLLLAIGIDVRKIPPGLEARAAVWRDHMAGRRAVLLLDDAISSSQVRSLLPGTNEALVLVTSRRRLTGLPEAVPITLEPLSEDESVRLFTQIVSRPGMDIQEDDVAEVVALCGHLPLAISMMAGQLKHRPMWTPADLAADLKTVSNRTSAIRAENHSVESSFRLSYQNLSIEQRKLFLRMGLHLGSDIDAYAMAELASVNLISARRFLDEIFGYHLINETSRGRFRFHDLIREYATSLAEVKFDHAEKCSSRNRLLSYYLHVTRKADEYLSKRTPRIHPLKIGPYPSVIPEFKIRHEAVSWMEVERLNLHAAVEYAASVRRSDYASNISAAAHGYMRIYGHWSQALTLHRMSLDSSKKSNDRLSMATSLNFLGAVLRRIEDYPSAISCQEAAAKEYHSLGNPLGEAVALSELGILRRLTTDYSKSFENLRKALGIYETIENKLGQATAMNDIGLLERLAGNHSRSIAGHKAALQLYQDLGNSIGEATARMYLGAVLRVTGDYSTSSDHLEKALIQYQEIGDKTGQANTLTEQGALQQCLGETTASLNTLQSAIDLYVELGARLGEANALRSLGITYRTSGDLRKARESFESSLKFYRELNNRQGEAEILNSLGDTSFQAGEEEKAKVYYNSALEMAEATHCALEKAHALEGLGVLLMKSGEIRSAWENLTASLEILRQIESPRASVVDALITDLSRTDLRDD